MSKKAGENRVKKKYVDIKEDSRSQETGDVQQSTQSMPNIVSLSTNKRSIQKPATSRKKVIDAETWVDKNLDELIDIMNIGRFELTREEMRIIALRLVDILRGESASIDKDVIKRRFQRYIQQMYQLIAQFLLELREELTQIQLEFVINNIGEAVLGYAPRLYREALRCNRGDLIEILRVSWRNYWILKKYQILPVECPVCKFNSLMPDLGCIVCGSSVSEEELKKYLDFEKLLKDFVKQYSEEDVKKVVIYGYIYLNSLGLKPPTHERDKLDIEVLLNNKEKELIRSMLTNSRGV